MNAEQMAALPTPECDAEAMYEGTIMRARLGRSLEQRLAAATMALSEVERVVSYKLRMRDAERHPEICAALVNARTTLALLRAK